MKRLCILGSTGSIGCSTLQVVDASPAGTFDVVGLAAGRNVERLAQQVLRYKPQLVSVAGAHEREALQARLSGSEAQDIEILEGAPGAVAVASLESADVVVSAMVGAAGLRPTLAALKRRTILALANKESLVVAGRLCLEQAQKSGATILPVDSEHSAIFQCLQGHRSQDVERILLTASGGPFRQRENLEQVTAADALAHPTWSMGPKITVDSATLMNKGLEVIEARWLFDTPAERIQVVVHPQSIVHSMVQYVDGSVIAQLGPPDMRTPIAYALAYPQRLPLDLPRLDLFQQSQLTFEPPQLDRFPCLGLAFGALQWGGTAPAVLNAANEVAVAAFLQGAIGFTQIAQVIEAILARHRVVEASEVQALLEADAWARQEAGAEVSVRR